jgi:ATP-dependent Lon protease
MRAWHTLSGQAKEGKLQTLPVLPIKNTVLFPYIHMPFSVGRPASLAALEAAAATEEKEILVFSQRDSAIETPGQNDLFHIGTKAVIKKAARGEDGRVQVIVLGTDRVRMEKMNRAEPYLEAQVSLYPLPTDHTPEVEALQRELVELAMKALSLAQPQAPPEVSRTLLSTDNPMQLVFTMASIFGMEAEKQQELLAVQSRAEALRIMHAHLSHEIQVLELRSKIASQAQTEMSKEQREYVLRQQLRAIQEELNGQGGDQSETGALRDRLAKAGLPEAVRKEAERELNRLERLPTAAPDYSVARTYLEFLLDLPWNKSSENVLDIPRTRRILDQDHFGLKEIKERILEQLGVLKLNPQAKAPILCLVGPPGVGKTSLGQSIARSMERKFERMSLGGVHDEAELRGHRRTYIGAMPGRIIQAIRRAGVNNPVLMLDEVDKLGRDFRGDPASALLEILDPEQNREFRDNYLDLPFDLSKVLFITTANTLDTIPQPLLDRMEVLRLPGYSEEEKVEIARRYLIPRQIKQSGLDDGLCVIDDIVLRTIISRYTREAGVRQLERAIGRLARKVALRRAEGDTEPVTVRVEDIVEWLGPERFSPEQSRKELPAGVATGLAWTESGGDVLYVEATLLPSGRGMTLTGQLGEVMQESARAAQSFLWSHAEEFGIDRALFRRNGVHVHVPAGAIPKDGPSAGVTMTSALASAYRRQPLRVDTAMTGEITLTGLVLPVGGIKEKVLAARRAGIKRVILPKENQKDLRDLPDPVRAEMEFIFAEKIEDVLKAALPHTAESLLLVA